MQIGAMDMAQQVGIEPAASRAAVFEGQAAGSRPLASGALPPPPPPGLIGGVELGMNGKPGVVIAATVVGYIPPGGLMVQVQLETIESEAEQTQDRRATETDRAAATGDAEAKEQAKDTAPGIEPAVQMADELSDTEKAAVQEMQARDSSVRREEQAHAAAAGAMAGPIQYDYRTGPDGRRYVVDGRVSIRYGAPGGSAEAAGNAGRKLAAAAMVAQAPSAADYAAAAEGYRVAGEADRVAEAEGYMERSQKAAEQGMAVSA